MANERVEAVIDRLLNDESFQSRFRSEREPLVESLGLNPADGAALLSLDLDQLLSGAHAGRLGKRKGPPAFRGGSKDL
jgi:hypothetical protein